MKRPQAKSKQSKKAPARSPKKRPSARRQKALRLGKPSTETLRPEDNPQAKALAARIASLIADKKGLDVVILDVRGKTSYADYVVVASGESERQVSSMAENVELKLKEENVRPIGTEGYDTGHWVLLDYGEVVAHLFYTEVRNFYDLEGLWADAPKEKVA